MSSTPPNMPPNMPPGGGAPSPYPPYDSKAQWRVYREQQKAAWRAQRDAWKAQQHAWRAGAAGVYGPRVPSVVGPIILIGVGVVALLLLTGHMNANVFWSWYGHWWPLLLIGAGLALLAEWALDLRRAVPVRRGGSFVGILILLALLGLGAAEWNHAGPWFNRQGVNFGLDRENLFNLLGLPEHDNDQPALSAQIPLKSDLEIDNPRGDVSVTAGDGGTIEVQVHQLAYADSDADARRVFDAETAHLTVNGDRVLVKTAGSSNGRVNLSITVPKTARVTVNSGMGDVTASGLEGGISVTASGDIHFNAMTGPVQARFSKDSHDFSAHDVRGDVTVDGNLNDFTASEITGSVTQNGEIFGDVRVESTTGPIHLRTSVTDLEVAKLPGDLTMDSDDLNVDQAEGPVRVVTHSKDIDLNQIYGDTFAQDRDGTISIEPAGAFGVNATNSKGDVELTLPPNASAAVTVRTHNGDIVSDYSIPTSDGENKSASFRIGSGTSIIVLSADNGDVHIKRGPAFPSAPQAATAAPAAASQRHLRTHKALPAQPVTQ